jgi:ribosomal protein S3
MNNPINIIKKLLNKRYINNQKKLQNIAMTIGCYYLSKYFNVKTRQEMFRKAIIEIKDLGITDLKLKGNILIITLTHPGLLIGRRGENINALEKELKDYKIEIKENMLLGWLYPVMDY